MSNLILVTGGCRSGKSVHAQQLAESLPGRRVFLATCTAGDDEMRARIARHQAERRAGGWETVEEPVDVADALAAIPDGTVMLDCLTLWVTNLMSREWNDQANVTPLTEDEVVRVANGIVQAARQRRGTTIVVTNEVGFGVVPPHELGRRFRDLLGRANQTVARAADRVILLVSGIPLTIKPSITAHSPEESP